MQPDWRHQLLGVITDPGIAYLLLVIGFYGLLLEFFSPGLVAPGVIGGISLLLGLFALQLLPVNYAGLALILLGIGLLIAEAFLFSHGILGTGGVVAFALGATILIDVETPEFRISWSLIGGVTVASTAFILLVVRTALSARRRKVVSGPEEMIGASGAVQDWSDGKGHVFVHGERWSASGDRKLGQGQPVRVTGLVDLTVEVEPVAAKEG